MRSAPLRDSILLVEDDPDIRMGVAELLREVGHTVFPARDGHDALRLLDEGAIPRPCLILLDWIMSPMSGPEFLEALRQRPDVAQLPIVVVSAASDLEQARTAPEVIAVLQKPFDIDALLAATETHCRKGAPAAATG